MSAFNLLSTSWIDRQGGVKTRRSGRRRILIAVPVLLVVLVLILSFPLYLTITGGGTLRRAYAHVTYEVMAHRASPVGKDPLQTVSGVMTYLHWRLNVPSDTPGRDRPPLEVAAEGRAYCNQIAVVHIQLVAKRGLSARIAMMRDKTGNSPHTIAEVNLNGRWIIVDPLNGILPGAERGGLTLDELKRDFPHIDNLPIFRAGFELAGIASNGSRQAQFLDWYRSFVISPIGPSRPGLSFIEGQRPKHRRIIKTTGLYHRMFGKAFSAFVQDIYFLRSRLWFKVDQAAGGKLTRARHYTLHARWHKALPLYQELLSEATGTVREDTLFFYGTALLQARNPKSALKILDPLDAEFPSGKWRKISQFYRGEALSALGKNKEALEAYRSAPKDLLTPAPYRLNGLRMAANSR